MAVLTATCCTEAIACPNCGRTICLEHIGDPAQWCESAGENLCIDCHSDCTSSVCAGINDWTASDRSDDWD